MSEKMTRDEALAMLGKSARQAGEDARRALLAAGPKVAEAIEGIRRTMATKR